MMSPVPEDEPGRTDPVPGDWVGLGLAYGTVALTPARGEWSEVAERLGRRDS